MACPLPDSLQIDDLLDFSHFSDLPAPPLDDPPLHDSSVTSLDLPPTSLPLPSAEPLYIPPDELADLEWLSTFVEDSYTIDNSFVPLGFHDQAASVGRNESDSFESCSPISVLEDQPNVFLHSSLRPITRVVKGRPRSKRPRTVGRVWFHIPTSPHRNKSIRAGPTAVEEFSEDSQSSSLEYEEDEWFRLRKKTMKGSHAKKIADNLQPRRCTHCQVQKTPQWRAGPMGPKTLCNACGVRYKSGRLVPEYRPAGSPSFVNEIHSNSHKKILEMRRYKYENWPEETLLPCTENLNASSDISVEMEQCNPSVTSIP